MIKECDQEPFEFHPLNQRQVVGRFDGGAVSTGAGGLLLREVEMRTGIIERFDACFRYYRVPEQVEHTVRELVAQRVYGLALGYEDLTPPPLPAGLAARFQPGLLSYTAPL